MALIDTLTLPQAVLAVTGLYLAWTLVRPFVVKTALDNLPGPPSTSFLTGVQPCLLSTRGWI